MDNHNILFYLYNYPKVGGIEKVTTIIANYLIEHKYSVFICSHKGNDEPSITNLLDNRIVLYRMPSTEDYDTKNVKLLEDAILSNNIGIVVYQDCNSNVDKNLHLLKRTIPFKLVTVLHSSPNNPIVAFDYTWHPKGIIRRITKPLSRLKLKYQLRQRYQTQYKNSDSYLLLSDRFIPQWKEIADIEDVAKLGSINNPITISRPVSLLPFDEKENWCVFCGRLSSEKGIFSLLKVWRKIENRHSDWNLIIIGDGPERESIINYITEKSLKQVKLVGSVSDPSCYYRKAKIITMASYFEGWPLVLGEAMSFGCVPILFDSYLSVHDIVSDGKNGILVTPFNTEEYYKKLYSLMCNPVLQKQMSAEAYQSSNRFSIESIGRQWDDLFQSL